MLTVETSSARDEAIPNWRFYFSTESTQVATDIEDLRVIGPEVNKNPATVNALLLMVLMVEKAKLFGLELLLAYIV